MQPAFVRALYDYNYWAWSRLQEAASQLVPREYERPTGFTYGSIRGILLHALWAEELWLARWAGGPLPEQFTEADLPAFDNLVRRWRGEEAMMRAFIERLTPEKLGTPVTYRSTRTGKSYSEPLWQLMVHVANHVTQHRAEAAEALTMAGHSPGDLDMLDFFRNHQQQA